MLIPAQIALDASLGRHSDHASQVQGIRPVLQRHGGRGLLRLEEAAADSCVLPDFGKRMCRRQCRHFVTGSTINS